MADLFLTKNPDIQAIAIKATTAAASTLNMVGSSVEPAERCPLVVAAPVFAFPPADVGGVVGGGGGGGGAEVLVATVPGSPPPGWLGVVGRAEVVVLLGLELVVDVFLVEAFVLVVLGLVVVEAFVLVVVGLVVAVVCAPGSRRQKETVLPSARSVHPL